MRRILPILLSLSLGFAGVGYAQEEQDLDPNNLEPAWSETQAYREYMNQQWVSWTIDDEIQAMDELIKVVKALKTSPSERLSLLQHRVSLLRQAKAGSHQAKQYLLKEFANFYVLHGMLLDSDKLLGIPFMNYLDHKQFLHARLVMFQQLNKSP